MYIPDDEYTERVRQQAKKEVIDDIDVLEFTNIIRQKLSPNQMMDEIKMYITEQLKQRHL